ncbi:MAG: MaoC family dehydratase [Gammaproteobacteria bacterium]|jgi:acyl dehydratase
MGLPDYAEINVDDEIPALAMPPLTRQTLAIYCGASGDHNPIHVDIDFARESGLDDVIAHGMLVMAYMGRMLTNWVPQGAIRSFETRFQAMTRIGDAITVRGRIAEKFEDAGTPYVRVEVSATDQQGEIKTAGGAVIALG